MYTYRTSCCDLVSSKPSHPTRAAHIKSFSAFYKYTVYMPNIHQNICTYNCTCMYMYLNKPILLHIGENVFRV